MLGGGAHGKRVRFCNDTSCIVSALNSRELEDTALALNVRIGAVHLCNCPGALDQDCSFLVIECSGCHIIGIACCRGLEILRQLQKLLACRYGLVILPALCTGFYLFKINAFTIAEVTSQHGQAPCSSCGNGDRSVAGCLQLLAVIDQLIPRCRNLCSCLLKHLGVVEDAGCCNIQRNCVNLSVIGLLCENRIAGEGILPSILCKIIIQRSCHTGIYIDIQIRSGAYDKDIRRITGSNQCIQLRIIFFQVRGNRSDMINAFIVLIEAIDGLLIAKRNQILGCFQIIPEHPGDLFRLSGCSGGICSCCICALRGSGS